MWCAINEKYRTREQDHYKKLEKMKRELLEKRRKKEEEKMVDDSLMWYVVNGSCHSCGKAHFKLDWTVTRSWRKS